MRAKHQLDDDNALSTRNEVKLFAEQKREENMLRHYEANTNKFKEDVKFDNFKRNVVGKHTRQAMQVKEKQLSQ